MPIDCPHCRNPLELAAPEATETVCESCGRTVDLGSLATLSVSPVGTTASRETERLGSSPSLHPAKIDRTADTFAVEGSVERRSAPREMTPRPGAETVAETVTTTEPAAALRSFGDYELLEEIARGGMGIVYRARQRSLNRIVAVKMVLAGQLASDAEVRRFRGEAEAAANLHHPNIVAIHEVGEHDSRHYFSMDFVEGTSLAALVRESPLPAKQAAAIVKTVAEAIHYAHQNGILHRDLKPSNVLLERSGFALQGPARNESSAVSDLNPEPRTLNPKITDFGLAKRLEQESGLTASGTVLGTPSYMPPEQAEGRHDRVSRASDIYSVGAILYELVTGRPPFRAESPIETLRQVLDAEPAAPSLLNPRVDRDLETICLKCLQKDPGRRYQSAHEMADDLGRFLRGEPIHARPVSGFERLWRWCRRNPRIAALTGVVILLLVTVTIGAATAAVMIAHEQSQTEAARATAHENYLAAESQRTLAEANFQKAHDAVNRMLTRVADDLLTDLPQTESVRRALLQDALQFYQDFLKQKAGDSNIQRETGLAYYRVGEITRMLGDEATSREAYEHAIALLGDLVARFPDQPDYAQDFALAYNHLGELLRTTGHPAEAERAYRKAVEIQETLAHEHRTEPDLDAGWARSLYNLGIVLKNTGRTDESESSYVKAIEILSSLCERHPGEPKYRHDLSRCLINRGILLKDTGKFGEAEDAYGYAIRILDGLVTEHPAKSEYRLALAACCNNMGNLLLLLRDTHRYADIATNYRRALSLYEKLVNDSPSVPSYRRELANSCNSLAALLQRSLQPTEAEQAWQRGHEIAEKLVAEYPGVPDYHHVLGGIMGNLGALVLEGDDAERARSLLERAVAHEQIALDSNAEHPAYRQFLRIDCVRLARTHVQFGDHARAARAVQQARELGFESSQECQRAAFVMAECAARAQMDEHLSSEQKTALAQSYVDQAISLLRSAIDKGYRKLEVLRTDAVLDPLRHENGFQELVRELETNLQQRPNSLPQ